MTDAGIKTWTFDFHAIPGREIPDYEDQDVVQATFDRNLERLVELENYGFEGVFFSEHHFLNSLSPTPNLLIAALAKMTTRMRLGVMGNVLPFHQPWRLAEELATLDYLTDGRLEIGSASGIPPEFLFVNMPPQEIRPRFAEILDFLDHAYADKFITYKGDYYDFEDIPSMPRPRQEARRRHWMTIYSPETSANAARRGYKVCTGYQSNESARVAFDAYRQAAGEIGRDCSPDDIGVRRQVLICESDARAAELQAEVWEKDKERIEAIFSMVFDRVAKTTAAAQISSSVQASGVMDAASVSHGGSQASAKPSAAGALPIDFASEFIFGSPATVTEKIVESCRQIGAGNVLQYHAQSLTESELDTHYRLFASIIPTLATAKVVESSVANV
ncbi:MAG TPA: LLM class flavin-dependent oxidoreductase [Ilumatobacteraceae bacterium]|nr:LLM class flavin-dependent oxidoreductase [Ilumatobacteraceae bacterium]